MSDDAHQQEDVAGLFRKFGGDASRYKEFAPIESAERTPGSWPLVNGGMRAADASPPEAVPPAAASVAALVAAPRVDAPAPTPIPAAPPVAVPAAPTHAVAPALPPTASALFTPPPAAVSSDGPAPRELDALFARLAGATAPAAGNGQGLMSRWRRPT